MPNGTQVNNVIFNDLKDIKIMDIKKLLENYNEFLFTEGYVIDQQFGVIDESAISDFMAQQQVKNNVVLPDVSVNEPKEKVICASCQIKFHNRKIELQEKVVAVCDNCKHKGTSKWLDPCHTCREGDLKEQTEL